MQHYNKGVPESGTLLSYFRQRGEEIKMTIDEASERYNIPIEVLKEYESWGLCGEVKKVMGTWQYDDTDLQRLSMIMTRHDIGFGNEEVEDYMRLFLEGSSMEEERLKMLKKRGVPRLISQCATTEQF